MAVGTYAYLSKDGSALPVGQGRAAWYKVDELADGSFVLMEKQKGSWSMVTTGKLVEVESWVRKSREVVTPTPPSQPTPLVAPKEFVHDITKVVMSRVAHLPGASARYVNNYIYMCLSRNKMFNREQIINTRLMDRMGQFIYILYTGDLNADISLRCAHLIDSISQAQQLYPSLLLTRLPDPIQWSDDMSDYVWDPTMEILKLSDRVVEHIAQERTSRMPESLTSLDEATLFRHIRESLYTGQMRATCDCAYALPTYSRRYDVVNVLLPLHIYTKDTELPEAVMLLSKTLHGYSLVTLITPQQAYVGVRAFRDPEMTWLKGAIL